MINQIKIPVVFLTFSLLALLPMMPNAWSYDLSPAEGHAHHGHGFHPHVNPDLTLVTGMDDIDSRVLVDPALDQTSDIEDEPAADLVITTPAQTIGSDMDTFIVNVPNNAGGYTPIRIQKSGNGYLGPQGELYYPFPEVSQLKAMYGL